MFTIEMLPGGYGDALWIEYGRPQAPSRILVDGGAPGSGAVLRRKLTSLAGTDRRLDLVVVTHIDLDHISGLLELLEDPPRGLVIGDFWFNGYRQLPDPGGVLGPKQAERLSFWIEKHGIAHNRAFAGGAVAAPDDLGSLPVIDGLPQGMRLTLLSPTESRLASLRSEWREIIAGLGLEPGAAGAILAGHPEEAGVAGILGGAVDVDVLAGLPFRKDTSKPNASSIAFLAEHEGTSCLFTGDAFADDLAAAIKRYLRGSGASHLAVDAWKLAHHGGKKNTSPELIKLVRCPSFLFSTSGERYHHPNAETIARVLVAKDPSRTVKLHFNYRSEENEVWDDQPLRGRWGYETRYPGTGESGVRVALAG
jgi:Metallo-beta-lactamase superfamily